MGAEKPSFPPWVASMAASTPKRLVKRAAAFTSEGGWSCTAPTILLSLDAGMAMMSALQYHNVFSR